MVFKWPLVIFTSSSLFTADNFRVPVEMRTPTDHHKHLCLLFATAGHLWTEGLQNARCCWCGNDVRSQEKLFCHRGQRPSSWLYRCARARSVHSCNPSSWHVIFWVVLEQTLKLLLYAPHPLQAMCWVCPTMTQSHARGCLGIWEDTTWWLLCLSAWTKALPGRLAVPSTSQSSLTTDTVSFCQESASSKLQADS